MKQPCDVGSLRPKAAIILAISLASALLVSSLCLTFGFSEQAYARERTDTITGKITLHLDATPLPDQDGVDNPDMPDKQPTDVSNNNPETSKPSVEQKPSAIVTIKKLLASTGDYMQVALITLVTVGTSFAAISYVARRNSTAKMAAVRYLASLSVKKKIVVVLLATALMSGTAFAVKQAVADMQVNSVWLPSVGNVEGQIVVNSEGELKSASVDIENTTKADFKIKNISASGDMAELINEQIEVGDIVKSSEVTKKTWNPAPGKIDPKLLDKLKENQGEITEPIKVDIIRNYFRVIYRTNDEDDKIHMDEYCSENETIDYVYWVPARVGHLFKSWNTRRDGTGEKVDAVYLASHPITADVTFYAIWKKFVRHEVFLAKTTDDKEFPYKIHKGLTDDDDIIPIDQILKDVESLKAGQNPNTDVYNDTNDKWHLFVHNAGNIHYNEGWLEFRIIHVGNHDNDGSTLTFHAVHGLSKRLAYDTNYIKDEFSAPPYEGYWMKCTLRSYLNHDFKRTLPGILQNNLKTVTKKSNIFMEGKNVGQTTPSVTRDKVWVPSVTELVKNIGSLDPYHWGKGFDDHSGSTYNFWANENIRNKGKGARQQQLFNELGHDRTGTLLKLEPRDTYANIWLRGVSPKYNFYVSTIDTTGHISLYGGECPSLELAVNPCFSL